MTLSISYSHGAANETTRTPALSISPVFLSGWTIKTIIKTQTHKNQTKNEQNNKNKIAQKSEVKLILPEAEEPNDSDSHQRDASPSFSLFAL